jgi:hypothetical protein
MRKCTLLLLACGILSAQAPSMRLLLVARFEKPLDSGSPIPEMERELNEILDPAGVKAEWFIDPALPESCENCRLVHIKFLGDCATPGNYFWKQPPGWLGRTITSDGEVIDFVEIDCNRVAAVIRPRIRYAERAQFSLFLGRALARVLAHELYHVLAKTRIHGKSALTRPYLRAVELLDEHAAFNQRDIGRMLPNRGRDSHHSAPAAKGQASVPRRPVCCCLPGRDLPVPRASWSGVVGWQPPAATVWAFGIGSSTALPGRPVRAWMRRPLSKLPRCFPVFGQTTTDGSPLPLVSENSRCVTSYMLRVTL